MNVATFPNSALFKPPAKGSKEFRSILGKGFTEGNSSFNVLIKTVFLLLSEKWYSCIFVYL